MQTEAQITGLINKLNDIDASEQSTLIRLKQVQIKKWEPVNILTEEISDSFVCKGNFSATILKLANKIGFILENKHMESHFQWTRGTFTIKNRLVNDTIYRKSAHLLEKRQLIFIDQLIDAELGILLNWSLIKTIYPGPNKRRTPGWYELLKNNITDNGYRLKNS